MENEQKTFLFVGGHQDGEAYQLPEARPEIQFPVFTPQKIELVERISPVAPAPQIERYFLEKIRAEDTTFFLYRHESLTNAGVFEKLLAGYKPDRPKI